MEQKVVKGISVDEKIVKVELKINDNKSLIKNLFSYIKENNIRLSMLKFDSNEDISFVINIDDRRSIEQELLKLTKINSFEYKIIADCSCITLVGLGFSSSPHLSIDIFELLIDNEIEIYQSILNNLSLSLLIADEDVKKTIDLLVNEYEIGE